MGGLKPTPTSPRHYCGLYGASKDAPFQNWARLSVVVSRPCGQFKTQFLRLRCAALRMTAWMGHPQCWGWGEFSIKPEGCATCLVEPRSPKARDRGHPALRMTAWMGHPQGWGWGEFSMKPEGCATCLVESPVPKSQGPGAPGMDGAPSVLGLG
jgi:hypothetical protein